MAYSEFYYSIYRWWTGKLLPVRTYDEECGAFYLDAESFGKKLAEHYGYKYVDYTQSTNDYGEVYEIKLNTWDGELNLAFGIILIVLIHIVNSFITA